MLSVFIHLFFFSGFCTLRALHSFPTRRSSDLLLAVVVMLPGMITGSSTAAVLTTGALVAPVLIRLGLDRDRAGAFVAMAAIYGMLAPPVNIPAMLIGGGVDLPYVGLGRNGRSGSASACPNSSGLGREWGPSRCGPRATQAGPASWAGAPAKGPRNRELCCAVGVVDQPAILHARSLRAWWSSPAGTPVAPGGGRGPTRPGHRSPRGPKAHCSRQGRGALTMVERAVGIGVLLNLLVYEGIGLTAGGMVAPGYLALFLDQPLRVGATLLVATATWLAVAHGLGRV